jgi:hypothetical protein
MSLGNPSDHHDPKHEIETSYRRENSQRFSQNAVAISHRYFTIRTRAPEGVQGRDSPAGSLLIADGLARLERLIFKSIRSL